LAGLIATLYRLKLLWFNRKIPKKISNAILTGYGYPFLDEDNPRMVTLKKLV